VDAQGDKLATVVGQTNAEMPLLRFVTDLLYDLLYNKSTACTANLNKSFDLLYNKFYDTSTAYNISTNPEQVV